MSGIINIVFSGLGGQGVLTMSDICAKVAMLEGYDIKRTDLHGLSQRGGVVESHLRIGQNIYSPLIMDGKADFNVSLDEKLSQKFKLKYLLKSGFDFSSILKIAKENGITSKELNFFMLGALSQRVNFKKSNWECIIAEKMNNKNCDFLSAFNKGTCLL